MLACANMTFQRFQRFPPRVNYLPFPHRPLLPWRQRWQQEQCWFFKAIPCAAAAARSLLSWRQRRVDKVKAPQSVMQRRLCWRGRGCGGTPVLMAVLVLRTVAAEVAVVAAAVVAVAVGKLCRTAFVCRVTIDALAG